MKALENKEFCKFTKTKHDIFSNYVKFPDFCIFFLVFPDLVATLHVKVVQNFRLRVALDEAEKNFLIFLRKFLTSTYFKIYNQTLETT